MSSVRLTPADDGTVRDRLIKAADAEIARYGMGAVKMEAVASRAGVSRATAFRQMGTVYELLVQVALVHAKRHELAVRAVMDDVVDATGKLEAALVYAARELPHDPSIFGLIARHSSSSHHPGVHVAAIRVLEPVLLAGRRTREIREDVGIDEIVDFLVEQMYLATESEDRSEDSVRRRFRHFIMPGVAAPTTARLDSSSRAQLAIAVQVTLEAVEDLARRLREQG